MSFFVQVPDDLPAEYLIMLGNAASAAAGADSGAAARGTAAAAVAAERSLSLEAAATGFFPDEDAAAQAPLPDSEVGTGQLATSHKTLEHVIHSTDATRKSALSATLGPRMEAGVRCVTLEPTSFVVEERFRQL